MATVSYASFGGQLVSENRSGTKRDYVLDPGLSTVALLDDSQTKTDEYGYWPFGAIRTNLGSNPTRLRYGGGLGYYESGSDCIYVRARSLSLRLAAWMSVDVLATELPGHSYSYVNNNPITFSDPLGLAAAKNPKKKDPCPKGCHSGVNPGHVKVVCKNTGLTIPWRPCQGAKGSFTCICNKQALTSQIDDCCRSSFSSTGFQDCMDSARNKTKGWRCIPDPNGGDGDGLKKACGNNYVFWT